MKEERRGDDERREEEEEREKKKNKKTQRSHVHQRWHVHVGVTVFLIFSLENAVRSMICAVQSL